MKIKVSTDFTVSPGPREVKQGDFSGELFRQNVLLKAYKVSKENKEQLIVDLDDVYGYFESFLEESFGGLVRVDKVDKNDLLSRLVLISHDDPSLIERIKSFIEEAN